MLKTILSGGQTGVEGAALIWKVALLNFMYVI